MQKSDQSIQFITQGRTNRGGHVVVTNVVRELCKMGYNASVQTWHDEGHIECPESYELWKDIPTTFQVLPKQATPEEKFIADQYAITEYLKKNVDSFDVLILDSWLVELAAIKAGIVDKKHVHQLVQSDAVFIAENPSKCWKAELFGLLPHVPAQRISVSKTLQRMYDQRYGIKTQYLPLFIDNAFHQGTFVVHEREQLRIVSSSATFKPMEKGLDTLLNALEELTGKMDFTLTLIAGEKIQLDFSKYSFSIQEKFAATPNEMVSLLQEQDMYVSTSVKESFGLAQAEAITLGMPVLALDAEGNRDFISGENAVMVHSIADLQAQILLNSSVEKRKKLHSKSKNSMKNYQLQHTVNRFLNIVGIQE